MWIVLSAEIQPVWIAESPGVAVPRRVEKTYLHALLQTPSFEIKILQDPALEHRQRSIVAQQFFSRRFEEFQVVLLRGLAGQRHLVGVVVEREHAQCRSIHGGLVAGVEQEDAVRDELLHSEHLALLLHPHTRRDQIITGLLLAPADQILSVGGELYDSLVGSLRLLVSVSEFVEFHDLGRPGSKKMAVPFRPA